jgi:hypothetical protein
VGAGGLHSQFGGGIGREGEIRGDSEKNLFNKI